MGVHRNALDIKHPIRPMRFTPRKQLGILNIRVRLRVRKLRAIELQPAGDVPSEAATATVGEVRRAPETERRRVDRARSIYAAGIRLELRFPLPAPRDLHWDRSVRLRRNRRVEPIAIRNEPSV